MSKSLVTWGTKFQISHDFTWFRMISHDVTWFYMISHDFTWFHLIFTWFQLIQWKSIRDYKKRFTPCCLKVRNGLLIKNFAKEMDFVRMKYDSKHTTLIMCVIFGSPVDASQNTRQRRKLGQCTDKENKRIKSKTNK